MDHLPSIQISGQAGRMDNYCRAVRGTGGRPVPGYCPPPDLSCSGLILCGGGDMDPALFGQEDRGSQPPDRRRDQAELELFRAFFQAGRPILAICRGMQVVNVALGGPCSRIYRERSGLSTAAGRRTGSTLCEAGRALCSTGCTAPYSR